MYGLHILSGPWKGKRVTVREPNLLIGRDAECHLRLPDDEVSRKHVLIEERPDGVTVRDQGSLNGFLVNNQPARESRLYDGAILELGRTRLQFRLASPPGGPSRRRIGWLQGFAAVAVAAVLLGQVFFLFALSMRGMQLLTAVEKTISRPAPRRASGKPAPGDKLMAEAQTYLKETNRAPSEPSEPASPSEAGEVSQEISQLRADVEDLRRQVTETAAPPAPVTPPEPAPPSVVETPPPPAPVEDPLVQRARAMLAEAVLEIQKVNLLEADQILERTQIMAPDFLPATIERARLYEQRGLLSKAGDQWAEVLQRSIGTPLYEQAAAERIRLARAATALPAPSTPARRRDSTTTESRLPRRIRLVSMEQEKLPSTEEYEEMRLLRISLRSTASERQIDPDDISVAVVFFDEDRVSKEIAPTGVVTPRSPLRVGGEWQPGAQHTVTATYMVPAGVRGAEEGKPGERRRYYGYAVRVYYREELQDEGARPKALLEKVRTLPSPFHKSARPAPRPAATNLPPAPTAPAPQAPPAPKVESSIVDEPVGR